MTIQSVATKLFALGFAAAFIYFASLYPLGKTWLAPILLLYIALMCWRHQLWLFALPALVPAVDLAPWTGWFFFEEIDLLLLITAAFGYWHLAGTKPKVRLPGFAVACIGAFTLAYLIAGYKGLMPMPALDGNAFTSYLSSYNSLRVAKGWCWALVLLPMLMRAANDGPGHIERLFVPGMLAGLALVSGADLWERTVFPGLMNFSSDYRTSAPFSAMHTGGAALDGYLALSVPFVAAWLLTRQSRLKTAAAVALLALGAYAGLSTFSRGLFAGYACSVGIIALFLLAPALRRQTLDWRRLLIVALSAALIVFALAQMFSSSGYRGFAAALILLAAAFVLAALPIPWKLLPGTLLCGIAIELILAAALPAVANGGFAAGILKPPYLLFSLSALIFAGVICTGAPALSRSAISVALMAFFCLALNTLWIAHHWAGPAALGPGALVVVLALLLIGMNAGARLWRIDRASLTLAAASAVVLLIAIPISASYYASERFANSTGDLHSRVRHWTQVLNMMDDDSQTRSFGMGLGKFPATYFWRNPLRELPGTFSYVDEIDNRHMRLSTSVYPAGYGEMLRLLQRVPVRPHTRYLLDIDIRRDHIAPLIHINVCERLLLYRQHCVTVPVRLLAPDSRWHHYQIAFDSASLGAASWPVRAPTQIELAVEGGHAWLEIDNVSLRDENNGLELISNGTFSDGNNYWFFSSDHYHLPWHVKNFALNLYFELGWLGVLSLCSLLAFALTHLVFLACEAKPQAAVYLASLAGFLVVGLFDSLLDVPRLSLLFFLVLFAAVLRPTGSARP